MTSEQAELLATLERADQALCELSSRGLRFASAEQRAKLRLLCEEFAGLGAVGLAAAGERLAQAVESGQSQAAAELMRLQGRLLVAERALSREVALALVAEL